jgi:hypothetical protein
MPVIKGEGCVGREMELFHKGQLHSGKSGKVVTDPKQAKAISLSACGESRYAEVLSSLGFSEETASLVVEMFAEMNWAKSFETGKPPAKQNPENYHTGEVYTRSPAAARIAKTGVKGDNGKRKVNDEASMIAGPALPKGPGNPQGGSSKSINGMQMLG